MEKNEAGKGRPSTLSVGGMKRIALKKPIWLE